MSFFDPPPPPPPVSEPAHEPWRGNSSDTVGGQLDLSLLVARSQDAAVIVSGIVAYPAGLSLSLVAITRVIEQGGPFWDMRAHTSAEEFLRFGMRSADGSKLTNVETLGPPPSRPPAATRRARSLYRRGGGGGGRKYSF